MRKTINLFSQKTLERHAALTILLSSLLVSGCARVVHPDVTAQKSSSSWGPLSGWVMRSSEPNIVVLNHASMVRATELAYGTGTPLHAGSRFSVQKAILQTSQSPKPDSAPLPRTEQENPFNHPAKKLPLPEEMPSLKGAATAPLPDRFDMDSAAKALEALGVKPKPAPLAQSQIPSGLPAATSPVVSESSSGSEKTPPRTQVQEKAKANATRARLADPQPAAPGKGIKLGQTAPLPPSALSLSNESSNEQYGSYKFSFTHEIWLLIFILGGVFATLWFRLEYDFGSRARRHR